MSRQLPPNATFTVAGIGKWQLNMTSAAIIFGGHVRVVLEDNIYYAKSRLAPNEKFVARTRRLAEVLQREAATADEAREILGLKPRPR